MGARKNPIKMDTADRLLVRWPGPGKTGEIIPIRNKRVEYIISLFLKSSCLLLWLYLRLTRATNNDGVCWVTGRAMSFREEVQRKTNTYSFSPSSNV